MKPRAPVTIQTTGEVYAVDEHGMGLLIGNNIWPMRWPQDRRMDWPRVGQHVACLLIPHGGRSPVYTLDHPPTVESWTPARVPAGRKA